MSIEVLRAGALGDVPHGFLGRTGGVSTGVHAGLNVGLGSDDERDAVLTNRDLARDAVLSQSKLVTLHQVHSARVVIADNAFPLDARPEADALVTARPGLLLGVLTADCVPILFADPTHGVVGAAHAGWKGALHGVAEATIDAMTSLGATRATIACAIGPCIGKASYEVSAGFERPFLERDPDDERFFAEGRPGHLQFDIAGYVGARLAQAGIGTVTLLDEDTYSQPARFFSYRRACHAGEPGYGRQISLIGLPA
ncbi:MULTISPECIES: peptidoglycan editing factor PgeF [unclassified Sphingobium]|uniref:peptidoglycan editing factor PgeF n=1 Tax=unclassified Sphingobium TaxID=2611147 RepID=UPI0022244906|nr:MULTISPECIES: peptidoglycan editing factor PgeF [unclassified Sphingobium]MCW2383266.1 YfiH family protein [Sphingobium sp. B2D3B]MCW2399759.1 YfiH family protein [Sphingobium sp. B2D3C]